MCLNALPPDSNVQLKLRTAELEDILNQWFSTADRILSHKIKDTLVKFFSDKHLAPWGKLGHFERYFRHDQGLLLASREWRPRMLLNIYNAHEHLPGQTIIWFKMSTVLR